MKIFDALKKRPAIPGFAAMLSLLLACNTRSLEIETHSGATDALVYIETQEAVRSALPDEGRMTDLNLYVFNGNILEKRFYLTGQSLSSLLGGQALGMTLVAGCRYGFLACANLGYEVVFRNRSEAEAYQYWLAYPDDYSPGMAMSVYEEITPQKGEPIRLSLQRMMARVGIRIDRSALAPDVQLECRKLKVGNCPRWGGLFPGSRPKSTDDLFISGFQLDGSACNPLNPVDGRLLSGEVPLYVMENVQPDTNPKLATYVEAYFSYESDTLCTVGENYLVYRFYLEDDGFRLHRGCHYHILIRPKGDGLGTGGWRVDRGAVNYKSGIGSYKIYPGNYIECRLGESVRIWTECYPAGTTSTFNAESLYTHSVERGMFRYELSSDGRSITLTALKKGSSMIDIDYGPPLDESHWVLVVCEP